MDTYKTLLQATILVLSIYTEVASGHGGMLEPPMRSVAWKYGFDAPVNYDWMSLYCGGLNNFTKNNGKCGLCGDSFDGPFDNDKGGMYDTGIIVRHYPAGLREIEVKVEVTAHHKGYFQFKLCPNNAEELTQECLDRYPLMIREGRLQGDPTRYFPPKDPKLNELHVLLPQGVICNRCVLQWTYTAGNNIDRKIQETFVNCADISINGTVDKVPVKNPKPSDGAVVVIKQRPDITNIIDRASPDSVNEVLQALTGNSGPETGGSAGTATQNIPSVTPGTGRDLRDREQRTRFVDDGFPPGARSRWGNIRDPRMMIPPFNDFSPDAPHMSNADTPGRAREGRFDVPRPSGISGIERDWGHEDPFWGQGPFGPHATRGPFLGRFEPFVPMRTPFPDSHSTMGRIRPTIIPPPSQVTFSHSNSGPHSNGIDKHTTHGPGTHTSLIGSVKSVAGQVRQNQATGRFDDRGTRSQLSSVPSRQFVDHMNELRRVFPNSHEWTRGDQMLSERHAVRPVPHEDTREFTVGEIRQLVPSLPSDIGPRQDIPPLTDRRLRPGTRRLRNNWFPRSRVLMQRRRMRQMPRMRSRLPRRIEVQSMDIAQHLLRKYPQLRGRVYLSRQGHIRNQFAHMMNRYARRQNWSRVR